MTAIFWLKIKNLLSNKKRLVSFLLIPIVLFVVMKLVDINTSILIAYYSFNVILLTTFVLYSVEELVTSEAILGTSITISEIWKANIIFDVIIGYAYSWIILIIAFAFFGESFILPQVSVCAIILNLVSPILSSGLIGGATFYYCDYSMLKQTFSSFFALFYFVLPFLSITKGNILPVNIYTVVVEFSGIFFYMLFSYFIKKSTAEKLIINSAKMVKIIGNDNDKNCVED